MIGVRDLSPKNPLLFRGGENGSVRFGRVPDTTIAPIDRLVVLPVLVFCGGGCTLQISSDFVRFCQIFPDFALFQLSALSYAKWPIPLHRLGRLSVSTPLLFRFRRPCSFGSPPLFVRFRRPCSFDSSAPVRSIPRPLFVQFPGPCSRE